MKRKEKTEGKIMDLNKLANLLVPDENVRPLDYYEELYPERNLPKGAEVTRLAPSPTGFMPWKFICGDRQRTERASKRRRILSAHRGHGRKA